MSTANNGINHCMVKHSVCITGRAEYAFKPKDVILSKKLSSSPVGAGKMTKSEIKENINRLSQTLANKVF